MLVIKYGTSLLYSKTTGIKVKWGS